jgi:hypothetical protein
MILKGLDILHNKRIWHGNLFANNVLIDKGSIKLHRYGLSFEKVEPADDVYMVGYIMYKMITKKSPIPDMTNYKQIPHERTKLRDIPLYDWKEISQSFDDTKLVNLIKNLLEDVFIKYYFVFLFYFFFFLIWLCCC